MTIDLSEKFPELSRRQRQVIALITKGQINKQIAITLGISHRTVEDHRVDAYAKLGVNSVAEMMSRIYGDIEVIA